MEALNQVSGVLSLVTAIISVVAAWMGLHNGKKIAAIEKAIHQANTSNVSGTQTATGHGNTQIGGNVNAGR